jgi:DNA-binding response OmpR family regulator
MSTALIVEELRSNIQRLEDENFLLKSRLSYIEQSASAGALELAPAGFTPCESKLLAFLVARAGKIVTRDALHAYMYPLDDRELKIIDVFICKLRKKLPPHIAIETYRGHGFYMTSEAATNLRAWAAGTGSLPQPAIETVDA